MKMAPKTSVPMGATLALPREVLPPPSSQEEAQITRSFRDFVQEHQLYVPNFNQPRDELPSRVATRQLQGIWADLLHASTNFELVCGLPPQQFVLLLKAADFLRVYFWGKEAARLLGHGREHLNWNHFAGMSYFAVDNPCYTHFKSVTDFLEALRQGKQVSKLFIAETSEFRWVYAASRLQVGQDHPMVWGLQATSLFPDLFARSTSYVGNEADFYMNIRAAYMAPNFVDTLPEPSVRVWFCASLHLLLTWISRGGPGQVPLTSVLQPFSTDMLNFAFGPRSAIWSQTSDFSFCWRRSRKWRLHFSVLRLLC